MSPRNRPPILPNRRWSRHRDLGFEDRDNFIRNLYTELNGWGVVDGEALTPRITEPEILPSGSAAVLEPVLTLDQIKMHLRIAADVTVEDAYLEDLEMAAHIHTENYLRNPIDVDVGENIKLAMLLLIAHWYRNRETVTPGESNSAACVPLAYEALLSPERDYPVY